MLKKAELERLELNTLAMSCLRVAESPAARSLEAEQAMGLKREWALLIGGPKPPSPGSDTPEHSDAQAKVLKERMVNFLSSCPLLESLSFQSASTPNSKAQGVAVGRRK